MAEKRTLPRKDLAYYVQVLDDVTQKPLGHLSDISTTGFKLDTPKPLPLEKDYRLCMNLTSDVATKSFMIFTATTRWCRPDPYDPTLHNVGFELKRISPEDNAIFQAIYAKYGSNR